MMECSTVYKFEVFVFSENPHETELAERLFDALADYNRYARATGVLNRMYGEKCVEIAESTNCRH